MADAFLVRRGGGEDVTAEVDEQEIIINEIMEALTGKATGANATPDKIVQGYSAYVGQELVEGTLDTSQLPGMIPIEAFNCTKFAVDKIVFSADITAYSTGVIMNHSLGIRPKFAFLTSPDFDRGNRMYIKYAVSIMYKGLANQDAYYSTGRGVYVQKSSATTELYNKDTGEALTIIDDKQVKYTSGTSDIQFKAGVEYTLITMA